MIITKSESFTKDEIETLQEANGVYIKAVIDIKNKICSAGASQHRDSYEILLQSGSQHEDTWGGGIIVDTKEITFTSMVNIRPEEGNTSNAIEDTETKQKFTDLVHYFFQEVL